MGKTARLKCYNRIMLICNNINHTTHNADGSYHHLEVPYLKATAGVPVIIDGDDDVGKQILINILSGLTFAQGADIKLFSSSPFALSLQHRHQTIGYFGDKDNFKPLFSVRDNLNLFAGDALDEILCRNLFEFFELDYIHFIDKEYGALDEEIQMILRAIGCFIAEPRAYFLHLPFCILPTHFHLVLCELLTQRKDDIVIISHQKGHFLPLEGDRYSLYEGKLWHQGRLVEPDASLEKLVGQFPLPENKEKMVTQSLEHVTEASSDSNVFAKFLTPIDDVTPIKKQDSAPPETIKIDPIQTDPIQADITQTESPNIEPENAHAIIDDSNDINMQADELTHETIEMMVDIQTEATPYPSDNIAEIGQENIPEIAAEIEAEKIEVETTAITVTDQPEIETADDSTPAPEIVIEEIEPEETTASEIPEIIEQEKIEEEPTEEAPIEKELAPHETIQITPPEKIDGFQQHKHKKFAYQPLDDTDSEIYQPTPSHFNHEPFIPPHADDPNIIAKFEQHLHHVPEIGAVFQRELERYQPVTSDNSTISDDNIT